MLSEAANLVKGSFVGFIMPRPPNLVSKAKSSQSTLLGGPCPV